jgi:hypothetical protein
MDSPREKEAQRNTEKTLINYTLKAVSDNEPKDQPYRVHQILNL